MQKSDSKREKLTILLAQVFISGMMAGLMTFIFTVAMQRFPAGWPGDWLHHFGTAWPIAFVLSLGVGPLAFRMAFWLMRRPVAEG